MSNIVQFHPYAEIFPLIEGEEFEQLAANIRAHGLFEPIWLYDGRILDGRNRYLACLEAEFEPKFREFSGTDDDALAFVISSNVHRRHLTVGQRAMAAAKAATLKPGDNQHSKEVASRDATSQAQAGGQFDVSRESVQRARKVLDKGSDDLKKAVETGEVALKKAAKVADLPKREQMKAAQNAAPLEIQPEPVFDLEGYEPDSDEDFKANVANVLMADDKLAAMMGELKQVRAELAAMTASRNHYQNQAGEAARMVKARDREIAKLRKQLERQAA